MTHATSDRSDDASAHAHDASAHATTHRAPSTEGDGSGTVALLAGGRAERTGDEIRRRAATTAPGGGNLDSARGRQPFGTKVYFVVRYSSMPSSEPSRPMPDCLTPPKGAAALEMTPALRPIIPVSSAEIMRMPRFRSCV